MNTILLHAKHFTENIAQHLQIIIAGRFSLKTLHWGLIYNSPHFAQRLMWQLFWVYIYRSIITIRIQTAQKVSILNLCRNWDKQHFVYLMFIGPCIIAIVDEWKTNLMSLAILFHLLWPQHVSDINISIFRSLRLCWWITTSVVLFCKDGCFSVSVNLRCVVVKLH